jgi:hypothetical protein
LAKGIDYTDQLPIGAVVVGADVKVRLHPAGTDLTATMIEGIPTIDPARVTALVKAGDDGTDYKITYLTTLTDGVILEDDLLMQVRDI